MSTRTLKRSRSGAKIPCPDCGKKLRGDRGLDMHLTEAHGYPPRRRAGAK